jgi:hypothetical protein
MSRGLADHYAPLLISAGNLKSDLRGLVSGGHLDLDHLLQLVDTSGGESVPAARRQRSQHRYPPLLRVLPVTLSTKVDAVQLHGVSADVTYEFQAGTNKLSAQPMTGTAVSVDGKWLVSQTTWSAWVSKSDIHGSA